VLQLSKVDLTTYLLPGDGPQAHQDFLALLHNPGETWIAAYGFTDAQLIAELDAADRAGVAIHCLLDLTQAGGRSERAALQGLQLPRGDVTFATAGPRSKRSSQIMHSKIMVVRDPAGGPAHCWTGSVNFSESGWLQANCVTLFRSDEWADAFRCWFEEMRAWARLHVRQS